MNHIPLFPDQASTLAPKTDLLFAFLLSITVFFTTLIFVLIVTFAIRYRRGSPGEIPLATHSNRWLEVTWIAIPLVLTMVMFAWGAELFVERSRSPINAMEIDIVGKQWMWKIRHPTGQREIDELHVPTGQPIKLIMTSQDVIHDFFIPAFRIKMDVLPNRYTTEWFEATKPGEYHLFCSQYCGTLHAQMVGKVVVMEPKDYQAWLAGNIPDESPVIAGQKLMEQYSCINCHSQRGPTFANLYNSDVRIYENGELKTVKADESYLRESIVNPDAKVVEGYQKLMPNFSGSLSEEQIFQLIAYIKTLNNTNAPTDDLKMNNRIPPPGPEHPSLGNGQGLMGPLTK